MCEVIQEIEQCSFREKLILRIKMQFFVKAAGYITTITTIIAVVMSFTL